MCATWTLFCKCLTFVYYASCYMGLFKSTCISLSYGLPTSRCLVFYQTRSAAAVAATDSGCDADTRDHNSCERRLLLDGAGDVTPAVAKYAYTAQQPDELTLAKGLFIIGLLL